MLSGEMKIEIERQEYLLCEGDLVLIKPNQLHSYDTPSDSSGRCIISVFSSDLIAAVSESLVRFSLPSPLIRGVGFSYREMFRGMNENRDIATVKGFLYTVSGLFYQSLDFSREDTFAKDSDLLRDIFIYLENNISESCTLKALSDSLGYNPSYLSRYFKRSVGIPYYSYVQSVKIDRAAYLLANTKESVLSVSIKCGFSTLSSFNRAFRIIFGMTPREYRKDSVKIKN